MRAALVRIGLVQMHCEKGTIARDDGFVKLAIATEQRKK